MKTEKTKSQILRAITSLALDDDLDGFILTFRAGGKTYSCGAGNINDLAELASYPAFFGDDGGAKHA